MNALVFPRLTRFQVPWTSALLAQGTRVLLKFFGRRLRAVEAKDLLGDSHQQHPANTICG